MIEGTPSSLEAPGRPGSIEIRDVTDPGELQQVVHLQTQIWPDDPYMPVPAHLMSVIGAGGGLVLGAYDGDEIVGFALGVLAREGDRLYHASHMVGIHPSRQGTGIGAALKQAQRDRVREQGLDLMTWTFDPLEARNAYFNLHKLGAVARQYKINVYGQMQDALNRGLPSDRLLVEWCLREERHGLPPAEAYPLLSIEGNRPILSLDVTPGRDVLSIAVPASIQQVKHANPSLALEWRLAVRQAFSWAFGRGYTARDFVRGAYLLAVY